eukprot:COSAG01_NODE_5643_length_4121_cov_2.779960_5_plen_122_part_00
MRVPNASIDLLERFRLIVAYLPKVVLRCVAREQAVRHIAQRSSGYAWQSSLLATRLPGRDPYMRNVQIDLEVSWSSVHDPSKTCAATYVRRVSVESQRRVNVRVFHIPTGSSDIMFMCVSK